MANRTEVGRVRMQMDKRRKKAKARSPSFKLRHRSRLIPWYMERASEDEAIRRPRKEEKEREKN